MKNEMSFHKYGSYAVSRFSDGHKEIAMLSYGGHDYAFDVNKIPKQFKEVYKQAMRDPHPSHLPLTSDEAKHIMKESKVLLTATTNALKANPVFALSKEEQQGYAQAQKNIATLEQWRKQANDNYPKNRKLDSPIEPQLERTLPNGTRIYDTSDPKAGLDRTKKYYADEIKKNKDYQQALLKKQDSVIYGKYNHQGVQDITASRIPLLAKLNSPNNQQKQAQAVSDMLTESADTRLPRGFLMRAGVKVMIPSNLDLGHGASHAFKHMLNHTANHPERKALENTQTQINPASSHLTNTLAEVYQISAIQNPRAQTH